MSLSTLIFWSSKIFLCTVNFDLKMAKLWLDVGAKAMILLSRIHPVRELDLAVCVSPSSNGSKMRSLWTNQMKS